MDNIQWLIGNDKQVNFWLDNWSGDTLANKFDIPYRFHSSLTAKVRDLLNDDTWDLPANLLLAFPGIGDLVSFVLPAAN